VISPKDPKYSHGAGAPSFFSVVSGAEAVAVFVGWPPRENVDGAPVGTQRQAGR